MSDSIPKVIVVGASGLVGKATLRSLISRHGASKLQVSAGSRNPSTYEKIDGVTAVAADMNDKVELAATLKGYDRAFLVIPGHIDQTQLGLNALEAAKEAGVKFVLLLSAFTVAQLDTTFGKNYAPLEAKIKELGIDHAIVRLPIFIDNNYAHIQTIKGQGVIYDARDPTKLHTPAAVADIGKASADILASPEKHMGKVYDIVSPPYSLNDMAAAFSKSLDKEVKMVTVPYDTAKQGFMGAGLPEWQVDAILELFTMIDEESPAMVAPELGHVEEITGEKPITIEEWVEQSAVAFK